MHIHHTLTHTLSCKLLNYITFGPGGPWIPCGPGSPCNTTHDINHISCHSNTGIKPLLNESLRFESVCMCWDARSQASGQHLAAVKSRAPVSQICCFNAICLNNVLPVCACLVSRTATCLGRKMMEKHVELQHKMCPLRLVFCPYSQPYCVCGSTCITGKEMFTSRTRVEYKRLHVNEVSNCYQK